MKPPEAEKIYANNNCNNVLTKKISAWKLPGRGACPPFPTLQVSNT